MLEVSVIFFIEFNKIVSEVLFDITPDVFDVNDEVVDNNFVDGFCNCSEVVELTTVIGLDCNNIENLPSSRDFKAFDVFSRFQSPKRLQAFFHLHCVHHISRRSIPYTFRHFLFSPRVRRFGELVKFLCTLRF